MIKRMIVVIDKEKCTGYGKCAAPSAEGTIRIINGKAKVASKELCGDRGFCIGVCSEDAISPDERQTMAFNVEKVAAKTLHTDVFIQCSNTGPEPTIATCCRHDTRAKARGSACSAPHR